MPSFAYRYRPVAATDVRARSRPIIKARPPPTLGDVVSTAALPLFLLLLLLQPGTVAGFATTRRLACVTNRILLFLLVGR